MAADSSFPDLGAAANPTLRRPIALTGQSPLAGEFNA